jgi:hypothetical protein
MVHNPFINIFLGRGSSSHSPSIVNVYVVVSAFASTFALLKFVRFLCENVIDWFTLEFEPNIGVVVLF